MVAAAVGPRPGMGLDIKTYTSESKRKEIFPLAILGDFALDPAPTLRERAMLTFMNNVTEMPGWEDKVFSNEGVQELEAEQFALSGMSSAGTDGSILPDSHCGFSKAMFKVCIAELQHKARDFKSTGIVAVLNINAAIFKKDTPEEFRLSIAESLKGVEKDALSQTLKNWQPDHNETLIKVVQPVLYPLIFGRTRVLTDRELGLTDCLAAIGSGHVIDKVEPILNRSEEAYWDESAYWAELSRRYQWLPTEVRVDAEGKARITSYINNLHPVEHADVYKTIERILDEALPILSATYNSVLKPPADFKQATFATLKRVLTIPTDPVRFKQKSFASLKRGCETPALCARHGGCKPKNWTHGPGNGVEEPWTPGGTLKTFEWFAETHRVKQPEPIGHIAADYFASPPPWTTVEDTSRKGRLQIFVTIGNILLTPEKPKYETGRYHVEGLVNERICASAIYYYDSDNITESRLSFQAAGNDDHLRCDQDSPRALNLYGSPAPRGCASAYPIEVGAIESRPGRLVVFPNVFGHRVDPFELKDPTRPGYRKVVGIFLVDPKTPIISTANVPPQQLHWAPDKNVMNVVDSKLPPEVSIQVFQDVGCPYSLEEAHKISEDVFRGRSGWNSTAAKTQAYEGHTTFD